MDIVEVKLVLPEALAREAQSLGLLQPEALEHLLREAIQRRNVGDLFAAADRLAALPEPLTEAEIGAEIQAAREERHAGPS
jgi:hypothetical protein